ncbi:MAG: ComEC/Rec2 family competence protein [Patescibacteria group bacterium]
MVPIHPSMVFAIAGTLFLLGVATRSALPMHPAVLAAVVVASIGAHLFVRSPAVRFVSLCLVALLAGVARYEVSTHAVRGGDIQAYHGRTVTFRAAVAAEPDVRTDHQRLTVDAREGMSEVPHTVRGRVLIRADLYPRYRYGDLLQVTCLLGTPLQSDPGSRFNYARYLARYSIFSICSRTQLRVVGYQPPNQLLAALLRVKGAFTGAVERALPEPQASFLAGLLLGAKRAIPSAIMDQFSRTGTTHIVALSGYNITIIVATISAACRWFQLSRRRSFIIAALFVLLFVAMTGAQASVVRAGLMGMLVLVAQQIGRLSSIRNLLIAAAVVMVLQNPLVLIVDTGFQLSFLATLGLVYVSPFFERLLGWLPEWLGLRSSAAATIGACATTTPLILWQFGRLSLVAPLVNVLILPAVPLCMALGFAVGLSSIAWPPLGYALGLVSWLSLSYILTMVGFFSNLPVAAASIPGIHWAWLVAYYAALLVALVVVKKKFSVRAV